MTRHAYIHALKLILFQFDPEDVHDRFISVGERLGRSPFLKNVVSRSWSFAHPSLVQTIRGITFPNPIGLSAGFDKNAQLTDNLPSLGFGFAELGSVTGEPCAGNPRPRLWRLPKSKSLLVYYGLKNDGCEAIAARLNGRAFQIPMGISVAKTNSPDTVDVEKGIQDYAKAFRALANIGSYLTINISCPNAFGGEPFTDPDRLERLLTGIDRIPTQKQIFLKLSPDLTLTQLDAILDTVSRHRVHGFICSNLTKNRENSRIIEITVPKNGGLSGKVVDGLADSQLTYIAKRVGTTYTLIASGGVFSAEDAYRKIRLGASLVQLITGMIFQGPQLIGEINRGLVRLLERDGFKNISEAVGVDAQS